jgi:hypothetical protein
MNVYTYSEARQKLASVLDKAESSGKVLIRRKDGSTFSLMPEQSPVSPLDVPSVCADITTKEIVDTVRKERSRARGWKRRGKPRAST